MILYDMMQVIYKSRHTTDVQSYKNLDNSKERNFFILVEFEEISHFLKLCRISITFSGNPDSTVLQAKFLFYTTRPYEPFKTKQLRFSLNISFKITHTHIKILYEINYMTELSNLNLWTTLCQQAYISRELEKYLNHFCNEKKNIHIYLLTS